MTAQRFIVACCVGVLVMVAFHYGAAPIESFLAEHGWSQVAGEGEACVVEDVTKRTPAIGGAVTSLGIAAGKRKIAWHVVDITAPGPDVAKIQWALDASKGKTLPVVCIRHGGGRATVKPLPDAQGAIDLISKI